MDDLPHLHGVLCVLDGLNDGAHQKVDLTL